jgi:peroxiredoxin Q/BCP
MPLKPGDKSPTFALPDQEGDTVKLGSFKGRKVLVYFYPKADTPGCTKEAIDFNALRRAFGKAETDVVGVSADPVRAQEKFRDKHDLAIPLASDEEKKVLTAYGVWGEKSLYGRKFMGVKRTTLLIGRDGRVARVWENVKVPGHAEAVLEAAKAL